MKSGGGPRRGGVEGAGEFAAAGDAEFGIGVVEVVFDGVFRHFLCDVLIAHAVGGEQRRAVARLVDLRMAAGQWAVAETDEAPL